MKLTTFKGKTMKGGWNGGNRTNWVNLTNKNNVANGTGGQLVEIFLGDII